MGNEDEPPGGTSMGPPDHETDVSTDIPDDLPTLPPIGSPWKAITDLKVSDGRVHIRQQPRERHGVGEGDVLDVYLRTAEGKELYFPEVRVGDRDRLLLPPGRREMHDLDGKTVDLLVRDSGG